VWEARVGWHRCPNTTRTYWPLLVIAPHDPLDPNSLTYKLVGWGVIPHGGQTGE